ncbi:MAG: hypothetical protein WDZ38_00595 [Balneolaceae bacterium]
MSIKKHDETSINKALQSIPKPLRNRLIKFYIQLKQAYFKSDYDATGSRSGKFSETLIRTVQHILEGNYTPFGNTLNLYDEAKRIEGLPKATGAEPIRVFIPRALTFLYTLRNKRGFAHVGGDLDSDPIDAITCVRVADWCLAELIRVVHNISLEEAQTLVNSLATKEIPIVWSVLGKRRVLKNTLDYKSQVLLLLYSEDGELALIEDLFAWTEYSRMYDFKKNIINPLHSERLIEWDRDTDSAVLSPSGIKKVESEIILEELKKIPVAT